MALSILDTGQSIEKEMGQKWGLPLERRPAAYYLSFENTKWVVRDTRQGRNFVLSPDLNQELAFLQKQRLNPKKDLLSRSLGGLSKEGDWVVDGTLGFGRDSLHLLACGFRVVGVEKNPITYELMRQALDAAPELSSRLRIQEGDVLDVITQREEKLQALYIDPMFENSQQKSAPKKGLAFLREISDSEFDVQGVISRALSRDIKRVVVKRPLKGRQLYGSPQHIYEGKLIRYDVYTR
jgi:hypothetical protein